MGGPESCGHLLRRTEDSPEETIAVTYTGAAGEWADGYRHHVGALPDHLAIVSVGEVTRAASSASSTASLLVDGVDVRTVEDPSDLTTLAIQLDDCIERWRTRDGAPAGRSVCFDSVTSMLEHVDLETAFKFLHLITSQLSQADAVGHFHLDADAHDTETIATLRPLFDSVIEDP